MSEDQGLWQRAKLLVSGLVFCAVQAPEIDAARHYAATPANGLRVDAGEGAGTRLVELPNVPDGCFLHWFFVQSWNRFIHVCGRHAELVWLETTPQPRC
jgi:hypothetical protein